LYAGGHDLTGKGMGARAFSHLDIMDNPDSLRLPVKAMKGFTIELCLHMAFRNSSDHSDIIYIYIDFDGDKTQMVFRKCVFSRRRQPWADFLHGPLAHPAISRQGAYSTQDHQFIHRHSTYSNPESLA